jgi:hypothetical protein
MNFTALPIDNYRLITIDENDSEPVESRLSEPEIVLGFIVVNNDHYFSVRPVTPFGVYDESPHYALICPDGKIYLSGLENKIFDSIYDLKQHLLHEALALYREMATDARKNNREDAALFSRVAKKLQREINELND